MVSTFVQQFPFAVAGPYFLLSLIFRDDISFLLPAVFEKFELNTSVVSIFVFVITQPLLQWDMLCYVQFQSFAILYAYLELNFWLKKSW